MANRKIVILIIAFLFAAAAIFAGIRLYQHEKQQTQIIADLREDVEGLKATKKQDVEWNANDYNYLAIGNSITKHSLASYWWNEIGMAASDAEHDYYHLVLRHLKEKEEKVHGEVLVFIPWEQQSTDRDETFDILEPYLSEELDLVTVQLGENALDVKTFEQDFFSLISFIRNKAPKARIIIIGDFWSFGDRDEVKSKVSEKTGTEYVSLEGIKDNADYYCGLGQVVYDADGNGHIVEHNGVASHPGDKGMREIAERIIKTIDAGRQ